jgi:hypothetical protein
VGLSTAFQPYFLRGTNCIDVVVRNTHGVVTGLNMTGTVTAENGQCCCEPAPNGVGCRQTNCPDPLERCQPTRVNCLGTVCTVLDCDCMGPNDCHIEFEEPGVVFCTGGCPPGQVCQSTVVNNPDGSRTIDCDCEPAGHPCVTEAECRNSADDNACNCARCVGGFCVFLCVKFGDVNCDGVVNLDDILKVLAGFSGGFAAAPNADLAPCGGNGLINLDDILAVLAAFAGANPCGCNPAGTAPLCGSISP